MSNYKKINVGNEGRTELHEALVLCQEKGLLK